jgi:hypothetical protein
VLPPASQRHRNLGVDVRLFPFEGHMVDPTPTSEYLVTESGPRPR